MHLMHISLTPELENIVNRKVESGLYNNASEVVREALRFMELNEDMVAQMKLQHLRAVIAEADADVAAGRVTRLEADEDVDTLFADIRRNG